MAQSKPRPNRNHPADRLAAELDRVYRRLLAVASRLGQLEELADTALAELDALRERYQADGGRHAGAGLRRIREIKRSLDKRCQLMAEHGTADFSLKLMADGTAMVRIDGKQLRLSPTLAALLAVLAADNGRGDGLLVGWKSLPEVAEQLTLRRGRVMRAGALRQNISRLRAKLEEAGVDRFLVQTQGSQARFALQRPKPDSESTSRPARRIPRPPASTPAALRGAIID
jgi:hypothetical protein